MKILLHYFGIISIIFSKLASLDGAEPQTPAQSSAPDEKILTYRIADDDNTKVKLKLSGSGYSSAKCYIKKSDENDAVYQDISDCTGSTGSEATNKCYRTCTGDDNKLTFDKFSPRTKYVVIFTGNDAGTTVAKTNGGTVFGLELPMLVNPKVTITTTAQMKLKLSTFTCKKVACPIYYNGVEYQKGTAGTSCIEPNKENEVAFNLMIPHYEMICENYPSFFYTLQNKYTLLKTDVYKPHYYVKYNDNTKSKYLLKFNNKFRFEICRFSIKEETTPVNANTSNEYSSNCGATNKDCYAPCNDVELIFTASKRAVEVMIQTRHFTLKKNDTGKYDGYIQTKFVITEPTADAEALLSKYTKIGVTLNVKLFHPSETKKFTTCKVTYYEADKPSPSEGEKTNCGSASTDCKDDCSSPLTITELSSGKPYIIVIAETTSSGVPASFKEHIFFRTASEESKKFPSVTPTLTETSASIKVLAGDEKITKDDITCAYYLSFRGKNVFVCATCENSYPCRGYCKDTQNIVGLIPGTDYDLMVIAHKEYGFKMHQFTTVKSTLNLDKEFINKGFKVIGTLSTPDLETKCLYNVQVMMKGKYELIHECKETQVSTNPVTQPIVKSQLSITSNVRRNGEEKILKSSLKTGKKPTSCAEIPLCSEILFTSGYDRTKTYRVAVTTVVGSSEASIDIPANPFSKNPDVNKKLTVSVKREATKLKVTSILPSGMEGLCGWELRITTNTETSLVKSCNGENDTGCENLPKCKEFEIINVDATIEYHLTVYLSSDPSINELKEIKKGDTYDTMKSTSQNMIIIIVASVVGVLVLVGVVVVYIKKKN